MHYYTIEYINIFGNQIKYQMIGDLVHFRLLVKTINSFPRILVWTGLFKRVFERAHERMEILTEPKSGSSGFSVCLGFFISKSGLDGYFPRSF